MDILDQRQVFSTVSGFHPDCVVHLAGSKDVNWCEKNPRVAYELNTRGSFNVAQAAAHANAFLLFLSSDYVLTAENLTFLRRTRVLRRPCTAKQNSMPSG